MGKNEICWAIFSGEMLLPFSIRPTRRQCIIDYTIERGSWEFLQKSGCSCRKIVINEYEKEK